MFEEGKKDEQKYSMLLSEIMDAVLSMSPNNFAGLKKTSLEIDIEEWKKRQVAIFTLQAKYQIMLNRNFTELCLEISI